MFQPRMMTTLIEGEPPPQPADQVVDTHNEDLGWELLQIERKQRSGHCQRAPCHRILYMSGVGPYRPEGY